MDVLLFLLISLMMISSGEGWGAQIAERPYEMETKHCSVFPNRTKCFQPIKHFGSSLREISYTMSEIILNINRGSVYFEGVKVTGKPENRIQTTKICSLATATCRKVYDYSDERDGPTFWKKNHVASNKLDKIWESRNQLVAKDLVITTRRERWECREVDQSEEDIMLYRIVSEHLTKKTIGEVNFPDNTFVHRIPIPLLQKGDSQQYTTVIREIKYTDGSSTSAKYDSSFCDMDGLMARENEGDFIELKGTGGTVTVSNYMSPGSTGKIIYKRKPLIEKDGAFKNQQSKATCDEITLDRYADKMLFGIFPEWSYSNYGQSLTSISKSEFREKFIITKYQMMKCLIEGMQEPNVFFRVEIEYLFTEHVNEVHVTDTIDNIYKFRLSKAGTQPSTEISFGIVENFDFNPENPTDAFRFAGQVSVNGK